MVQAEANMLQVAHTSWIPLIHSVLISRIEKNQRHVCDAELLALSKALNVSMDWLCGEGEELVIK